MIAKGIAPAGIKPKIKLERISLFGFGLLVKWLGSNYIIVPVAKTLSWPQSYPFQPYLRTHSNPAAA